MRHSLKYAALFTALLAAACSDVPTTTPLTRTGSPMARSLSGDIDQMVVDFFPTGLETATGTRWQTVKDKLAAGDLEGATRHLITLTTWVQRKTNDISAPHGETPQHAATRLVLAMSTYVYVSPDASVPTVGADVVFAIVPAGAAATITTPSQHAALDLETGSTNEDRIIVVSQELTPFPDLCSGPLPTSRCQYPLFYKFESFPDLRLNKVGRFAVCHVTSGDRAPLGEVDGRMRLAHNKPESSLDYTPGGYIIEGIEVLPKAATQKGLVTCEGVTYALAPPTVRGGWLGRGERALYAVANLAGRLLTPKNLYAWDSGPEHESIDFSNFNGVDPVDPTGSISGTVRNAFTNAIIGGATVTAGDASTTSNSDGTFTLTGVTAGTHDVTAIAEGYNSAVRSGVTVTSGQTTAIGDLLLSPAVPAGVIRVVLEWGATPNDLDSHLTGPIAAGGRFHVFYAARCYPITCPATGTIASLDRDDTDQYGPETITLYSQIDGTYSYYVHNYSGLPPLTTSGATVRVFSGETEIRSFAVPTTGTESDVYWHVFNLSGGNITVVNSLLPAPPTTASLVAAGSTANSTAASTDLGRINENVRSHAKPQP